MKNILLTIACSVLLVSCDFLDRPALDSMTDEDYWETEANVRSFVWGFYPSYFVGYGSGDTWGSFFTGGGTTDDYSSTSVSKFNDIVPTSGGGWTFEYIRKANILIDRVQRVSMSEEAKAHWTGVGRFFRAMEYADLSRSFGDFPWYDKELKETNPVDVLYRPRDSRVFIAQKIIDDFEYAVANIRPQDGTDQLTINRNVALAYMSRQMLYFGTLFKYHNVDAALSKTMLEKAKWAADEVIKSGKYSISDDYLKLFTSLSLAKNPEIILYREYEAAIVTHNVHTYNGPEAQTGASQSLMESYLCTDGKPIKVSSLYQGNTTFAKFMSNRDPRMVLCFRPKLHLQGITANYSTTGYSSKKFFSPELDGTSDGSGNRNTTDAPIMRYAEVLLNYAEACAELGAISQNDLDKSINLIRARKGVNMPPLSVNVAVVDPSNNHEVDPLTWEIRRERRVEMCFEGLRNKDLKRWKQWDKLDTEKNTAINRGAYINPANFATEVEGFKVGGKTTARIVDANGNEVAAGTAGLIKPAFSTKREFLDARIYLDPLPMDQITLYKDKGVELTQNPGWIN